ncbi:hypothetical protein [Photorhabdus sp. CRCIA-P01]|uniref:hypothetical protein n=1 Tax=Photorhabdus sp. CRCIA-P01 TaxID=2019570 RepID=UPI000E59AC0A|nr:hypothetical protein [Photorhabdus sp. CRCIA-P01]
MLVTSVAGASVVGVAIIVFLIGVGVTVALDYIDKKYKISEAVINLIKKEMERKSRTPEADLNQIFYNCGRYCK